MIRTQGEQGVESYMTAFVIVSVLIIISALGAYGWLRSEALVRLPLFFIILSFFAIGSIAGARAAVVSHLPMWLKTLILLCHLAAVLIAYFPLVIMVLMMLLLRAPINPG